MIAVWVHTLPCLGKATSLTLILSLSLVLISNIQKAMNCGGLCGILSLLFCISGSCDNVDNCNGSERVVLYLLGAYWWN